MKIAIIGTRGIPNHYGGFEQFAEYLSKYLVQEGQEVTVYNSHMHPYQESNWMGVDIVHCKDPEDKIGTAGQFIYDLNCIRDARKRDFDMILQLGYTSSSVWGRLLPKKAVIITNMDGLEWKRSKFGKNVRRFLKKAEKLAVKTSDYLIADSVGIQQYLQKKYNVRSHYIPYGANLFTKPDESFLEQYNLLPNNYDMLVARLEPENSIEIILDGVAKAAGDRPFLVVGKHETKFGEYLKEKFRHCEKIRFLGGIYDIETLNNVRCFSNIYFHGHTVGGTNPSLLEAMASQAFICANDNIFNKAILEGDALYFRTSKDVQKTIESYVKESPNAQKMLQANDEKILRLYSWDIINKAYLQLIEECLYRSSKRNLKYL
ncbi:DUF1972 domain-containing protein [Salegentibacter flavus]|uniref:Glycosyltransferase involved in cell wall bisynthesis n=1 Tax=Salegentibacter flavus TaxID=287099 RepID=A0A1I5BPC6_9FLAO|nr:DUF1972 domain-containing protein [Salegentibacter flavus]SFN76510.1 Glycosyltransferase involved in cell wall bisynthesis [Salegentibacter flavus]